MVTWAPDDAVWFDVRAFSRPDNWFVRLGRPVADLLQDIVSDRYAAAALRPITLGVHATDVRPRVLEPSHDGAEDPTCDLWSWAEKWRHPHRLASRHAD